MTKGNCHERRRRTPRLIFAATIAAAVVSAQNGSSFLDRDRSSVPYGEAAAQPTGSCSALVAETRFDYSILSAELIEASAEAPEHCRVSGVIPAEIRFEVNLPAAWNRRLYMHGNGGYAGTPPDNPNRIRIKNNALRNHFATTYTDTGHDRRVEPLGEFAYDNLQKEIDYSFRAVHLTVLAAKEIVRAYYGRDTAYSYWDGCSTGGRQGLMSAQRFPLDFDGIVAGAPVLNFTGTMIGYLWKLNALEQARLSLAKVGVLAEHVYARCDARDGLEDGLIDDPRNCDFDPGEHLPLCESGAGDDCFTGAEVQTLEKIYSAVKSNGKKIFPGQPLGAEAAPSSGPRQESGWNRWIINEEDRSIQEVFAETFLRYMAFPEDDPEYDWRGFDFDKDPERMEFIRRILDATNPDLSSFEHHGGKMIMYFGWADAALNPLMAVNYYEEVLSEIGETTTDFFRLYMVPGMFHCRGGLGVDRIDAMTPLIEWVETGAAPESIRASRMENGKTLMTRPVCPYPQVAKYKGAGDSNEATNFVCADP